MTAGNGSSVCTPQPNAWFAAASRAWLLAVALFFAGPAQADDPPGIYSFRSYGPDQGLRNQAVTSLAQDAAGFIYAGTEDGLFRYDGDRFERFGTEQGLPSDSVTLLHANPRGELWVATRKGLVQWNVGARAHPADKVLLAHQEILDIASSLSGRLLVSTASGPFEGDGKSLARVAGVPARAGAGWLARDGSEALLALGGTLLHRDARGRWRSRALPQAATESAQSLLRDSRGRIWVRGRQMLLRLRDFAAPIEDLGAQLPGAAVQKGELREDRAGRIWAPTNRGIALFEGERRSLLDVGHGLPHEWATTVLIDREGSLWVASEGVHRLQGRLAWSAFASRHGLPSDTVWAIHRDRGGTLWAATNRGVAKATDVGWSALPGLQDRSFYTFAEDAAGNFWIGGNSGHAGSNTLLYRAKGTQRFVAVPLASAKGASTINSMVFGADQALYVATMAHGLHRITRDGGAFASEAMALPGGAPNEQINQLARDRHGRLWVAGMRGLALFDGAAWRRLDVADGLRESEVETITDDGAGGLWVSYWNLNGLTRLRVAADGRIGAQQVGGPEAWVGDTIYTAGRDRRGALWLGTAMGVKRWRDGSVERFGRADGLPGEDAAANAFWADDNGNLWFGMANGLARFDASRDPGPPPPPGSRVTSLTDGKSRVLATVSPRIAWPDRALTFHFASLSYVDPGELTRQVRLLGFEDDWRDSDVTEARYTGLLPGRYQFQTRARHGDGRFGPTASRSVVILAPWWLSWWFLLLVAIAVLGLLAAGHRWQLRRLNRRNQQLEALVASRTRDLQVANEALEEASMVDPLTGLKNRRYLKAFMPEELAHCLRLQHMHPPHAAGPRDHNIDLCVMLVDLDHFKSVNDTHGHGAGDNVLRQVGKVLRAACRASDVVVRWGGEEFLILARNADRYQAWVLAAQVCEAVRSHHFTLDDGVVLRKTCSLGYTAFPLLPSHPEKFDWEQAVELADQCLYAAKNSGRDAWVGCLLQRGMQPDAGPEAVGAAFNATMRDIPGYGPALLLNSFEDSRAIEWKP